MRGRPRKKGTPINIHIRLRLWPGEDDDLIALLAVPRLRARLVKAALRGAQIKSLTGSEEVSEEKVKEAFEKMIFW